MTGFKIEKSEGDLKKEGRLGKVWTVFRDSRKTTKKLLKQKLRNFISKI